MVTAQGYASVTLGPLSTQVVLIRGVNVGGKNKVSMAQLRDCLESLGCTDPQTYLNSGNAIVASRPEGFGDEPSRYHSDRAG